MEQPREIPAGLLTRAGAQLGAPISTLELLPGGYTPQQSFRLSLADGRRAVLKAAAPPKDPAQPSVWTGILRQEIHIYRALPALAPWRPARLGNFEQAGWVVLLIEDLADADRVPPWTAQAIAAVARGLAEMHARTYGEATLAASWRYTRLEPFFERIQARGHNLGDLPGSWDRPEWWNWLDGACATAKEALAALEPKSRVPGCITHCDVRSDNLFLRVGRMVLIDWASAEWASPALDSVHWAISVEVEGGGEAARVHQEYLQLARDPSEAGIRGALAHCAGYFLDRLQSGSGPTYLKEIRLRFLRPTLAWFAFALDLPAPPVE